MHDPNTIPWDGLVIVVTTVAVVFGAMLLMTWLVRIVGGARDELRERYVAGSLNLRGIDVLGIPTWIALEVVCLIGNILLAAIVAFAVYSLATSARDWWHEWSRGR